MYASKQYLVILQAVQTLLESCQLLTSNETNLIDDEYSDRLPSDNVSSCHSPLKDIHIHIQCFVESHSVEQCRSNTGGRRRHQSICYTPPKCKVLHCFDYSRFPRTSTSCKVHSQGCSSVRTGVRSSWLRCTVVKYFEAALAQTESPARLPPAVQRHDQEQQMP